MAMHFTQFGSSDAVVIRQLWLVEQGLFRQHFDQLDAAARSMRFGGSVHDSFIDLYVQTAFSPGNMVFGAFAHGGLVGVGEIKLVSSSYPVRAEAAFSVVPQWQNKGVGDYLISRIMAVLQNRGAHSVQLWCNASNSRMRHLATKHGARFDDKADEDSCAKLELSWPTPSSYIEEICGEAMCYAQSFMQVTQATEQTSPANSLPS